MKARELLLGAKLVVSMIIRLCMFYLISFVLYSHEDFFFPCTKYDVFAKGIFSSVPNMTYLAWGYEPFRY